jgi:hypothetical protein
MVLVNKNQVQRLHILLQETGQKPFKQDLMDEVCIDGRFPTSSKQLYVVEYIAIEQKLLDLKERMNNQRRRVISALRECGYNKAGVADMERIYAWVQHYSATKKHLNTHTCHELVELVKQADQYRKAYLKGLRKK